MTVAIFIPVYQRPDSIVKMVENLKSAMREGEYRIYFIYEQEDTQTIDVLKSIDGQYPGRAIRNKHEPCYAGAINTAYEETKEPYFFTGADDIVFYKGWLDAALLSMKDGTQVIGTNDLGGIPIGPERDSTHYLVARSYIEIQSGRVDAPNTVLYPYDHNYTDKEFVETARKRGVYQYCPESIVEHMHWAWGKSNKDATYQKGFLRNEQDKQMYLERQKLWQ